MTDQFAPWITDPDDPADIPTPDDATASANAVAAMFPELVDKSNDGPIAKLVDNFASTLKEVIPDTPGRDPHLKHIIQTFMAAADHLDKSEAQIRDMIEGDLMDIAGINRTKVGDAVTAGNELAKKIILLRTKHIKEAFRHLRDNLPSDI